MRGFSAWSHLVCLLYAQLTRRDGLRDLCACMNSQSSKLYHLGVRQRVVRSTLADASERRSFRLFEDLGLRLVNDALALYADQAPVLELSQPLYAMDSTVIELCLSLFPWAKFGRSRAAVKVHTAIDLRGSIPVLVSITAARVSDISGLDELRLPSGSIVVLDRGYIDYARLHALTKSGIDFVIRAKSDMNFVTLADNAFDASTGVCSDLQLTLRLDKAKRDYPAVLRRVRYIDPHTCKELVFISNRLDLSGETIAQIYKKRWQIELFFKWLKQNLNVAHFFGNSENAVKAQIWSAICAYLLALIAHKPLSQHLSLHTFLHLIEINVFESVTLHDMVMRATEIDTQELSKMQTELFS